jgi:hypothetical protein
MTGTAEVGSEHSSPGAGGPSVCRVELSIAQCAALKPIIRARQQQLEKRIERAAIARANGHIVFSGTDEQNRRELSRLADVMLQMFGARS